MDNVTMRGERDTFLLIGQSNMAGRGRFHEVTRLADPRVLMFRDGLWIPAEEPLHADRPNIAGVGLGMSFAVELLRHVPQGTIGLLPCAVGGTPLRRWMPGADLYTTALSVARLGLEHGVLKGILWHQGENDSGNADDARSYGERFTQMIEGLRADLGGGSIPVIAGELGEFLEESHWSCARIVNQQLRGLERTLPLYGCVSAEGLADNGDRVHFDSRSLRELGIRYANKFLAIALPEWHEACESD